MSCVCSYSQSKRHAVCDSIDSEEAVMLNILAFKHGIRYDFTSKKVAFYTGSGGGARRSKDDFLPICRAIDEDEEYDPISYFTPRIYIFNEKEKARTDGYDAVIIYGSVKQYPSKKSYIRKLRNTIFKKKHRGHEL
jgi:hypothetical protein